jgi:hypothetical protein
VSDKSKPAIKSVRLTFCGLQRLSVGWMPLWNIAGETPDFGLGSTVSEMSLKKAGYFVPNPTGYSRGFVFDPGVEIAV